MTAPDNRAAELMLLGQIHGIVQGLRYRATWAQPITWCAVD
jgi:hypothetical protein